MVFIPISLILIDIKDIWTIIFITKMLKRALYSPKTQNPQLLSTTDTKCIYRQTRDTIHCCSTFSIVIQYSIRMLNRCFAYLIKKKRNEKSRCTFSIEMPIHSHKFSLKWLSWFLTRFHLKLFHPVHYKCINLKKKSSNRDRERETFAPVKWRARMISVSSAHKNV